MGKENQEEASDSEISSAEEDDFVGDLEGVDAAEDPNLQSMRHKKQTNMDTRAQEDMDFPDEVETPLKNARVRF